MGIPAINRTAIVQEVADTTGEKVVTVDKVVDCLLEQIGTHLVAGHIVKLRRFGNFELRIRHAVTRRNPRTGTNMEIPDRLSVAFIPSGTLKNRLNF